MTLEEASKLRSVAEAEVLATLRKLSRDTGLDMIRIEAFVIVEVDGNDHPRRIPRAVRIELAV